MEAQVLQQALQNLPNAVAQVSTANVRELGRLVDGDLPLQSFLERLLPQLCSMFEAPAAVAWMAHGASGAVFGVRYRMDELFGSIAEQKKHEQLVQLAWRQKQTLLAEPSAKTKSGAVDNPTGYPLLFGPVLHLGEPVALLEIVLKRGEQLSPTQRQLYLRCIQLVSDRVYGGLKRRMTLPAATIGQATGQLNSLTLEVQTLQLQIRQSIEARLQQFHGWSFASLAENQEFAKMVHQLLDSHGMRVKCPECGNPAILRCLRAGNAKHGAFVFDHYLETGRTFHGGPTTVPMIHVVAKPARRAAINN